MDNTIAFSPISFRLQTSGFLFPNKMRTKVEKKKINKAKLPFIPSHSYPYSGERGRNAIKIPANMSLTV